MEMKTISYILLFLMLPFAATTVQAETTGANTAEQPTATPTENTISKKVGDEAYDRKEYDKAIGIYEAVIEESGATSGLYYNLGNAYFRSNEIGKAILNYERALRIDPTDEDIKTNLEFAQTQIKDEVLEQHEIFFVAWFYALIGLLGVNTWAIIAVAAFMMLLVGITLFLLVRNKGARAAGLAMATVGLFVSVFANIAALLTYNTVTDDTQAIVMKEEVTMMSAPGSSTALMKIHEGRKVTVTDDSIEDWKEIELEDGTIGWVKKSDIERI